MTEEPRDDDEAEAKARSALKDALHLTHSLKELREGLGNVAPETKAGRKATLLQRLASGEPPNRVPEVNDATIDGVPPTKALWVALDRLRWRVQERLQLDPESAEALKEQGELDRLLAALSS